MLEISPDVSPFMPPAIIGALKKYNWGNLAFDTKVCKTNVSSKSTVRAPGDVQGSFIDEAIIEHIASALSVDTNTIRRKNLHDFESLEVFYGKSVVKLLHIAWSLFLKSWPLLHSNSAELC
jgi:xanthine dehydrogenase molybdopterin-binding subunit B